MAEYCPADRMSCVSLEDEQFFSACSSQPVSRLMSIFAAKEQEKLADDVNSAARPSEPLVSVCLEPAETGPPSAAEPSTPLGPLIDSHQQLSPQKNCSPVSTCCQVDPDKARLSPAQLAAVPSDEASSTAGLGHSVDNLVSSPAPAVTTRDWSSPTGREPCLSACHYQGRLPITPRAPLEGYVSRQKIDDILCHIHAYLSTSQRAESSRRHSPTAVNENDLFPAQTRLNDPHLEIPPQPENQYLITTDNIIGILDIVIASVHSPHDDGSQLDYQSFLFPSRTHSRPTLQGRNIIPSVSAPADPATTICSPRPCFSLADGFKEPEYSSLTRNSTHKNAETESDKISEYQAIIYDLYNRGIDAHGGSCIYNPLPILVENPQTTSTTPGFSFSEDHDSPTREYENVWPSQTEEGDGYFGKKFGGSIGAASHRRIGFLAPFGPTIRARSWRAIGSTPRDKNLARKQQGPERVKPRTAATNTTPVKAIFDEVVAFQVPS
ncbi:hypothetical protein F5Y14DRAFT_447205 [Nemania sp. NC0429]|nr:hypothetical protein F5Y14DRAFT_447205 [Nemania sp. NC0429]